MRARLDELGVDDHPVRALALKLAEALDQGAPATAMAGIVRELVKLLAQAEEVGAEPELDFVDQLRAGIAKRTAGLGSTQ